MKNKKVKVETCNNNNNNKNCQEGRIEWRRQYCSNSTHLYGSLMDHSNRLDIVYIPL